MKADSAQSRLLIAALLLLVALLAGIAWQASRSVAEHRATANAVLEDYAQLAADEFARRAIVATGYYGIYPVMTRLNAVADDGIAGIVSLLVGDIEAAVPPADTFFVFDAVENGFSAAPGTTSGGGAAGPLGEFVSDALLPLAESALPESGFAVMHGTVGDERPMFVVAWTGDGAFLYGFTVDWAWLAETVRDGVGDGPLLPASLTDGADLNDLISIAMLRPLPPDAGRGEASGVSGRSAVDSADDAGLPVFSTGESASDGVTVERLLDDEYGGLFRGFTVRATIDRELAGDLIIGGLPADRVPLIATMIVLAAILLAVAVNQLRREAAVTAMRANFVAEVSHELRTPLTQIRMFTESLRLDRMRSPEDRDRALSIIERESKRLIHLVENILRFSGNGPSDMRFRPDRQALAPIVSGVANDFSTIAAARDVRIETRLDSGIEAPADADALRQILINLLDNAIKYGPPSQTIVVSLDSNGGRVRIAVDDEGPGVPEAERERIWSDFVRLERDRDRATAGTGIGLAVVAELTARHGGRAWVEDGDRGGARFIVELPS